jgi:UDP-N-acetylenolpyruvoylglucosamine reductase
MSPSLTVPEGVAREFPLSRLTTIRTGGPAEYFARAGSFEQLQRLLGWAIEAGLETGVVGSGSNLLIADSGVRGLVIKLDGSLARIEHRDGFLVCGGGARLPQASARAAALGLGGLEFGVNIPGTVGGAVRMNANAYGGQLQRVLEWVDVCTAQGTDRRRPEALDFSYRRSNLRSGEVVARACFRLEPGDSKSIKESIADMRARRKATQPSGVKTFGSTFKNPDAPQARGMTAGQLLEEAGCSGLAVGGARFSPKHANFIENVGGNATTAEVLALMAEGRRRVSERFGVLLEPEVQLIGKARFPD